MTDLFIIAAGKGSRMGGSVPKALVPISGGEPNLTTTLKQCRALFDDIYVVTNEEIQDQWEEYFQAARLEYPHMMEGVYNTAIISGRGDGHAVLEGLKNSDSISDEIVIVWGDVFIQNAASMTEILDFPLASPPWRSSTSSNYVWGVVPVLMEANPYVAIKVDKNNGITHAEFSKYGEVNDLGYHDQSIFKFKRRLLLEALEEMDATLNKGNKYITPNGEMSLLYLFHHVYNTGQTLHPEIVIYETHFPTKSFNTVEEVASIQEEIKLKWQNQFSLL